MADALTVVFTATGLIFLIAGTIGLIRFPDSVSRLHALTKADNLGLGFIVLGVAFQADGWARVAQLALIWGLALFAAAAVAQLVARSALAGAQSDPLSDPLSDAPGEAPGEDAADEGEPPR